MKPRTFHILALAVLFAMARTKPVRSQDYPVPAHDPVEKTAFSEDFLQALRADNELVRPSSTPRLRMYGMPAGFLANPLGMDDDEDQALRDDPAVAAFFKRNDDLKNVQILVGNDNPYFDLLRPGGVGGLGYYKIYSQVQVLDTGTTSLCLDMQTYTPAGIQWGGLAEGPTVFCPAVSWFHDLGHGTALQGFVSENINASPGWNDSWNRRMYYGLALQCPLLFPNSTKDPQVFFFVQALGRFRYDVDRSSSLPALNVLPGIQWHMADNCWLSVGGSGHGLFTCSWQF